jgi:hypothetical protein
MPRGTDADQPHGKRGVFAITLLASFGISCGSINQSVNPDVFYKRDMLIEINDLKAQGTLVVPKSKDYWFEIEARGKLDLFTLQSCHREITREKAGEGGIFGNAKKVQLGYTQVPGLEDQGGCQVQLGGYEREKGRNSWALIDFETDDAKLPARLKCNGSTIQSSGVSICQSRAGLIQEIYFAVDTIANPPEGCEIPRPADLKTYRFTMPKGQCVLNFMEKGGDHREHRLTTLGYEGILIRED